MAINYGKYILSTTTHWISNSGKDENSGTLDVTNGVLTVDRANIHQEPAAEA